MPIHRSASSAQSGSPSGSGFGAGFGERANDRQLVTRCRRCGILIGMGEHCDFCQQRPTDHVDAPGEYQGRHHTEWIATLDELLLQGDTDAAEFLLVRLVDASEAESLLAGVPPFERHFTRLGQIARSRGDETLSRELKRRFRACEVRAPGRTRAVG